MDPDGDYESRHSTRSTIGDILPKDAKLDNVDDNNKKCNEDGFYDCKGNDEEMGLKPSPTRNTSKVLLADEKGGRSDLKASAPPAVDLGCLASAPPLEPSMHPSPEDDATAPTTPESSHPPEPPGFKDEPIEKGGSIPDSVALPIGLDNADRALPIASVVPIITDATGAEIATPPTQPTISSSTSNHNDSENAPPQEQSTSPTNYTADRAPSRRVPYLRPVPTHPAHDEREKQGSQGWKCTPCKKALCLAVIIIAAVVAVGLTIVLKPKEAEPSFASLYPNCHVIHKEWIGDGKCNDDINYNKRGCGWDGGDCIKEDWPNCHANTPKAFRGLGNGKCNTAFNVVECGFDLGDCRPYWSKEDVAKLKDLENTYPGCYFDGMDLSYIGDSECNGGHYNTEECGWDGGDCVDFNRQYPNCDVEKPYYLGDEDCDSGRYNTEECGWDGGDCILQSYPDCHVDNPAFVGNNDCDGDDYNSEECGWDGGDCINDQYPDCQAYISWIGDGDCDGDEYNTAECGWDGGDCDSENALLWQTYPKCNAGVHPDNIGDGYCDGGGHNTAECKWDGGDCLDFNTQYPDCKVEDPTYIGDDDCDGGQYNTAECKWDGGDCILQSYPDCHVDNPAFVGNNDCDGDDYNSEECGWDGGDCINDQYPDCHAQISWIGDGDCDGDEYNTAECGWDGGDCDSENALLWQTYPKCKAGVYPNSIGDGYCDGGQYNTVECKWDGGDCLDFNTQYPDCKVEDPTYIGDDDCDGGQYNTAECNWDGGDCLEFNRKYPDCDVEYTLGIGDGECDVDHNMAECGWDDGDCAIYNGLPDCHVDKVFEIGNGDCYVGEGEDTNYMTPECNYDGGDCLEFKELIDRCGDDFWHCISWTKYDDRDCTGDWWLWTSKNNLEWCQEYCVQLGSRCKAVSRSTGGCTFYNEPNSGTTVESGTKCFKKTVLD